MCSAQVLDHFERPRNVGELTNPTASAQLENPACGDIVKLTVRIREGQIEEAAFLAQGCVATVACASALTELLRNATVSQARDLGPNDLQNKLGGLPEASAHASQLA